MTFYGQSTPPDDYIAAAVFEDYIGVYCDVGAYDGVKWSNTYHFYEKGWQGINFEPNHRSWVKLKENQPKAFNIKGAASYQTDYVPIMTSFDNPIVTGFNLPQWYVEAEVPGGLSGLTPVHVATHRIDDMLDRCGFKALDYLSVDTDGYELEVLQGLDFARWQPRLIITEYTAGLPPIDALLSKQGYICAHIGAINAFFVRDMADVIKVQRAVIEYAETGT